MSTAALLCFCTETRCLEITPSIKEFVLAEGSSLSLTCSGSGETAWELKREDGPDFQPQVGTNEIYEVFRSSATASVLLLTKVSWRHTGVYLCTELDSGETKEVAVFVPGEACFVTCRPVTTRIEPVTTATLNYIYEAN